MADFLWRFRVRALRVFLCAVADPAPFSLASTIHPAFIIIHVSGLRVPHGGHDCDVSACLVFLAINTILQINACISKGSKSLAMDVASQSMLSLELAFDLDARYQIRG